jgi:hypothetical protein
VVNQVKVYILQHSYEIGDCTETKMIGIYSSGHVAELAIERLRSLPGFASKPDDFYIDEYQVDQDHWTEGFVPAPTMQGE